MSSHTSADASGGAPLWALMSVKVAPVAGSIAALFENASAGSYVTGQTIGLFNYADAEVPAGAGHAGWNLKVTGSGGRVGRVQYETLVALTNAA